MFIGKRQRELDAAIMRNESDTTTQSSGISVKVDSKDRLFSEYSYSGDKLNEEFGNYIFERAKRTPIKEPISIEIHSPENIDAAAVDNAIKRHFGTQYIESKYELKRLSVISAVMTLMGVLFLSVMLLLNYFLDNIYINTILEIASWVFIWEAVDFYFLQRPAVKAKCLLLQRIYFSEISIESD